LGELLVSLFRLRGIKLQEQGRYDGIAGSQQFSEVFAIFNGVVISRSDSAIRVESTMEDYK